MGGVLEASRSHGLTVNAFLAAAARFMLRYLELSLAEFAYPDPSGVPRTPKT
jgi:hypothetical protein